MLVSLRDAKKLQSELRRVLGAIKIERNVLVIEGEDVAQEYVEYRARYDEAVEQQERIVEAVYAIRGALGRANVEHGVSDLLAEAEMFQERSRLLEQHVEYGMEAYKPVALVERMFAKSDQSDEAESLSVESGVLSRDERDAVLEQSVKYRRQADALRDQVLVLNVSKRLALPEVAVEVMREHGIELY